MLGSAGTGGINHAGTGWYSTTGAVEHPTTSSSNRRGNTRISTTTPVFAKAKTNSPTPTAPPPNKSRNRPPPGNHSKSLLFCVSIGGCFATSSFTFNAALTAASCCFAESSRRWESSSSSCLRCQLDFAQPLPNSNASTPPIIARILSNIRGLLLGASVSNPFAAQPRADHCYQCRAYRGKRRGKIGHCNPGLTPAKFPQHEPYRNP